MLRAIESLALALGCLLTLDAGVARAALVVTLDPLLPSDQPVGTVVRWIATASGAESDPVLFRFDVATLGGPFRLLKDYYLLPFADWTPTMEGVYLVKVTARNWRTGETAEAADAYLVGRRVTGARPVVSRTANPLVALYSAPPCASGRMRVNFLAASSPFAQSTPFRPCTRGVSMNFYVAGMRAETTYFLQHELVTPFGTSWGPVLPFLTGSLPPDVPRAFIRDAPDMQSSLSDRVILHSRAFNGVTGNLDYPFATDLLGRVIWYHIPSVPRIPAWTILTRPLPGGTFLMTAPFNLLREFDVAGNTIRETSAFAIMEQLRSQVSDPIGMFHHEAIRLPNGHTLAVASLERIVTDVQGPGPVDVLGDIILDLDEDWRVVWFWNSFDFLDIGRKAVLDEKCDGPLAGCSILSLAWRANDWTHINSIHYERSDGSLILSIRNQDWVIKVDYGNGAGTGRILWRMGRDGDFTIDSDDPDPWFSHQHDVSLSDDGQTMLLYDNGNTRRAEDSSANSRGQVLRVDESLRRVTLDLNVDLGDYAEAVGSAQTLSNGNYQFLSGILNPGLYSEAIEVLPNGERDYVLRTPVITYRSFRMKSLYEP